MFPLELRVVVGVRLGEVRERFRARVQDQE